MKQSRKLTVSIFILFLVFTQCFVILTKLEIFPFNPSLMYHARFRYKDFWNLNFVFFDSNNTEYQFKPELIAPMDKQRLYVSLERSYRYHANWKEEINVASKNMYELYTENLKFMPKSERPSGYIGFRVYKTHWGSKESLLTGVPSQSELLGGYNHNQDKK